MENETIETLYARREICLLCIRIVSGADDNDPRKLEAIAEYNRQLASIDAQIAEIEGKPPPIVIGLKPAILFPKAEGAKHV